MWCGSVGSRRSEGKRHHARRWTEAVVGAVKEEVVVGPSVAVAVIREAEERRAWLLGLWE